MDTKQRFACFLISVICSLAKVQAQDGLYFNTKVEGEDISYFSPYHEYASMALLTRCNGESPIRFNGQIPKKGKETSTYYFLVGHSSGTSGGERQFDWYLNRTSLFTMTTLPKQKELGRKKIFQDANATVYFNILEYDINGDAFGWLEITVPKKQVQKEAFFEVYGKHYPLSRDWMMVFQYQPKMEVNCQATSLIYRNGQRRCMQISANNIEAEPIQIRLSSRIIDTTLTLAPGYNLLSIPSYPKDFSGVDTLMVSQYQQDFSTPLKLFHLDVQPHRHYEMNIIHHSHNDIGYSHHQTEVEKIQTQNIRSAMRWIAKAKEEGQEVFWHIESLWAVENFMKIATQSEKNLFVFYVKSGNLVLSINYANVLNGLCHPDELPWILEYGKKLESMTGRDIRNAMITDIPGITYAALNNYVQNDIPFLSLGPNYVEKHADHGDRVGSVIEQTGDTYFYWHPNQYTDRKVLVWTAGKGYSYFHNIQNNEKQFQWEKRIAHYANELTAKKYPETLVQLRYTKNADNGPVDTTLHTFVQNWNNVYSSPTLSIASLDQLYFKIEKNHEAIPHIYGGEISPYWEDGAFSTAKEEIEMRQVSRKLVALEKQWQNTERDKSPFIDFYSIHRDVVLFHEHTWGSWCSISDPYSPFTTQQWHYKKSFLTEAKRKLTEIEKVINRYAVIEQKTNADKGHHVSIQSLLIHPVTGGIGGMKLNNDKLLITQKIPFSKIASIGLIETEDSTLRPEDLALFSPIYNQGINPTQQVLPKISIPFQSDNDSLQTIQVHGAWTTQGGEMTADWEYRLNKKEGKVDVQVHIEKDSTLEKESLHFLLSTGALSGQFNYGSHGMGYPAGQLPGSNREFICSDGPIVVHCAEYDWVIESPDLPLIEIGQPIDETQEMGAKVWKRDAQGIEQLYLYVFNNYWHTNYRAEQGGPIDFSLQFRIYEKE
ncbi:MAG: hypothetical protein RLY35_757 [Bacteroidota bacterium]|jgi:hypothetical protein